MIISNYKDLLQLHDIRCSCSLYGTIINDAKICIENDNIYICHNNPGLAGMTPRNLLGYKYGWNIGIAFDSSKYEIEQFCIEPIDFDSSIEELNKLEESEQIDSNTEYLKGYAPSKDIEITHNSIVKFADGTFEYVEASRGRPVLLREVISLWFFEDVCAILNKKEEK